MKEVVEIIFFTSFATTFFLLVRFKMILKSKGHQIFIWPTYDDYASFTKIIKNEKDQKLKKVYEFMAKTCKFAFFTTMFFSILNLLK